MRVSIHPAERFARLELRERGEVTALRARAMVAALPPSIAERELAVLGAALGWPAEGGVFRTQEPSGHTRSQIEVVKAFLGTEIGAEPVGDGVWEIRVGSWSGTEKQHALPD